MIKIWKYFAIASIAMLATSCLLYVDPFAYGASSHTKKYVSRSAAMAATAQWEVDNPDGSIDYYGMFASYQKTSTGLPPAGSTVVQLEKLHLAADGSENRTEAVRIFPDKILSIDSKLNTASVPATTTILGVNCDRFGCYPGGNITISASWTAQYPANKQATTYNALDPLGPYYSYRTATDSISRQASATVTIDGQTFHIPCSEFCGASIVDAKVMEMIKFS